MNQFPTTDIFSHIEVADGRLWIRPEGVACFAGDLSNRSKRSFGLLTSRLRRTCSPKCGRNGLEVQTELVYRGH